MPRTGQLTVLERLLTWVAHVWRSLTVRPGDELANLQEALSREIRRAAMRTLGGAVCYPRSARVRLHPQDMRLWRDFRDLVQQELEGELRAQADRDPKVQYFGCRVTAVADEGAHPGQPRVEVDWLPVTEVIPPSSPSSWSGDGADDTEMWSPSPSVGSLVRGWLVLDEPGGKHVPLPGPGEPPLGIGRDSRNAARVPAEDRRASKRHARIACEGPGRWVISDLCSANGTIVDDSKITGPVALAQGTSIQVGATVFRVEIESGGWGRG